VLISCPQLRHFPNVPALIRLSAASTAPSNAPSRDLWPVAFFRQRGVCAIAVVHAVIVLRRQHFLLSFGYADTEFTLVSLQRFSESGDGLAIHFEPSLQLGV
jgi:hypothetical protein